MKLLKNLSGALCLSVGFSLLSATVAEASSRKDRRAARTQNVVERLAALPQYSTLVTAVTEAGLVDALAGLDRATIFAPTNEAFAKIPEESLTALLADTEALTNVLTYHVVAGRRLSSYRLRSGSLEVLNGGSVEITKSYQRSFWWRSVSIEVNDSKVVEANIRATNGIIHGIDTVLDPAFEAPKSILEIAAADPDNFSTLASLVESAGLSRALDSDRLELTVFAPTNAAFAKLPAETLEAVQNDRRLLRFILKNHIVRGRVLSTDLETGTVGTVARTDLDIVVSEDGITVENANVGPADVIASNGVVHVIDEVLVPEILPTLVGLIDSRDDLSTFKVALDAAGYTRFLDYASRYWKWTLLAPNNTAFEAVPADALAALLEDRHALRGVLNRHIAFGQILSTDLSDGLEAPVVSHDTVTVAINEDGVSFNGAPLVEADLEASNGVIHVIGGIIPEPGAATPEEPGDEEIAE